MSTIALETPLAEALSSAVHAKIVDEGWTQEDDTSLAEYILLMLANGKTEDQIASELAGELLQDAKGTTEFAQWLFNEVHILTSGATGPAQPSQAAEAPFQIDASHPVPMDATDNATSAIPAAYDMDMGDAAPENAQVPLHLVRGPLTDGCNRPRGPKGLQTGRLAGRGGRGGSGHKGGDSVLHRVRGNDRVNTHSRGPPKGPRNGRDMRPGMQKALSGAGLAGPQAMQNAVMMNGGQGGQPMMQMTPQQQMEFMAMMEQQTRMLAQFTGMMPGGAAGAFPPGPGQSNGHGRSLFDRVEPGRGRGGGRGRGRGAHHQNGTGRTSSKLLDADTAMDGANSTAGEGAGSSDGPPASDAAEAKPQEPFNTMCHFNLRCTNKDCAYAHQSPSAPDGTVVDLSETCSFGVTCKNSRCVGKHPSPAQVRAFQAQELCKFFPNCTKPNCPFKHPTMPICRFGANCKTPNCQFTHLQTPCRFNPCTNLRCPYKHEPGQQKVNSFADFSWTPEKQTDAEGAAAPKDHLSDRKFVDDQAEEELIKPSDAGATGATGTNGTPLREEVIT